MIEGRLLSLFSGAFALIYFIAVEWNLAAITYHPRLKEWVIGTDTPKTGPAMYWFGWIITAAVGAFVVTLFCRPMFRDNDPPTWFGWFVPLVMMALFGYSLSGFFLR